LKLQEETHVLYHPPLPQYNDDFLPVWDKEKERLAVLDGKGTVFGRVQVFHKDGNPEFIIQGEHEQSIKDICFANGNLYVLFKDHVDVYEDYGGNHRWSCAPPIPP
jgi:hypothetical protein